MKAHIVDCSRKRPSPSQGDPPMTVKKQSALGFGSNVEQHAIDLQITQCVFHNCKFLKQTLASFFDVKIDRFFHTSASNAILSKILPIVNYLRNTYAAVGVLKNRQKNGTIWELLPRSDEVYRYLKDN